MDDLVPAGNEGRMTWMPECNTICQPLIHQADLKCYNIDINIKGTNSATYYKREIKALLKYLHCNCILQRYGMTCEHPSSSGKMVNIFPELFYGRYIIFLLYHYCSTFMLIFNLFCIVLRGQKTDKNSSDIR